MNSRHDKDVAIPLEQEIIFNADVLYRASSGQVAIPLKQRIIFNGEDDDD